MRIKSVIMFPYGITMNAYKRIGDRLHSITVSSFNEQYRVNVSDIDLNDVKSSIHREKKYNYNTFGYAAIDEDKLVELFKDVIATGMITNKSAG